MYLKASTSKSIARPTGGTLLPTLIHLGNVSSIDFNAQDASGKWSLRFQTLNALINYQLPLFENVLFIPYMGAEILILNQMTKSEFTTLAASMKSRWESDFFGVGLMIGARIKLQFCSFLSFFSDVSARIIHGNAEMDDHFRIQLDELPDQNFKLSYTDSLFIPGCKIIFGLSFSQEFYGKVFSIDAVMSS